MQQVGSTLFAKMILQSPHTEIHLIYECVINLPKHIVSNQMEEFIGIQWISSLPSCLYLFENSLDLDQV